MFIGCHKITSLIEKTENIIKSMKLNVKLTYKVLILGHKTSYEAYDKLNLLISHIFYAIYKYWLKNDDSKNIMTWVYMELVHWQRIYIYRKQKFTLLKSFIEKW